MDTSEDQQAAQEQATQIAQDSASKSEPPADQEEAGRKRRKREWDSASTGTAAGVVQPLVLSEEQKLRLKRAQDFAAQQTLIFRSTASAGLQPAAPSFQMGMPINSMLPMPAVAQLGLFQTAGAPQMSADALRIQQERMAIDRALSLMSRIYVGSIPFDLGDEHLRQAFSPFGTIKDVSLSWDAALGKHKGFAFVEYELPESASAAEEHMQGATMGGRPIKVGRPNNAPGSGALIDSLKQKASEHARIYVAGIHGELSEPDIREVFEAFGAIKSCSLCPDRTNPAKHRGYGFIEFETQQAMLDAVGSMNKFNLAGMVLKVCRCVSPPQPNLFLTTTVPTAVTASAVTAAATAAIASVTSQAVAAAVAAATTHDTGSLEQEENVSITGGSQRIMMMQKLSRADDSTSRVILLRNMVTAAEVDSELKGEVIEECGKFGRVLNVEIFIVPKTQDVKIFVQFVDNRVAIKAIEALNGRYFAGRSIAAALFGEDKFAAKDFSD
eukprot:m.454952 g.454952  ORF g.454952 m.454952 type:complete len:498 (+) comp56955_c0_seq5:53-1546(+)